MRLAARQLALSLVFASSLPVACSATSDDKERRGGSGASGALGVGGGGVGAGGPGGFNTGGGSSGAGTCSADLRQVLDESGKVVEQCPEDEGCHAGQCIPACDAAAKSKGTIGCDFRAPDPPFVYNGEGGAIPIDGPCYAVFLANTWPRAAKLQISRGGQSFDATQFGRIPKGVIPNVTYSPLPAEGLPPNEVAILFLSHKPGVQNGPTNSLECPVPPAVLADAAVAGSGKGQAFHVASDTPVSAYAILPYGGAKSYLPSATLLFPTSAWGSNYYAISPHPESRDNAGKLWMILVAAADNTQVDIVPQATLPGGGGLPTANQNQTTTITLNAGESAQWIGGDPTSTVIASADPNKPIGLWTGNTYLAVQTQDLGPGGSDSTHQQIAHIQALGSEYVSGSVVTRLASLQPESVLYRIMGVVDGTTLSWDPKPAAGAPATLAAGEVVQFETKQVFSVRAQDEDHPFALSQYMAGTSAMGTRDGCSSVQIPGLPCSLGDEEWVMLVPPKQFLQRYVFFTDPTYGTTNLVVTRVKGANGFPSVKLECLGNLIDGWQPVGAEGRFEYAHVELVRGSTAVAGCGVSRHEATSDGQFGVMVWGTDYYASYGYPAGGNVGSINNVFVPPQPN